MLKYDIDCDWCLVFKDVDKSFIAELIAILGINGRNVIPFKNANCAYKIKRSLDIVLPIILTKCIKYKVDIYRDSDSNKFIISVINNDTIPKI